MVRYSPRAAKALAYLKTRYNAVDIFVEDTGNHNMWLLLLKKILGSDINLRSVNLLGGKDAVVQACRLDQDQDDRRKLYIVDADFDFALALPKPQLKHLYRLRGYCLENLLIRESPVIELGLLCNVSQNEVQLRALFDFPQWHSRVLRILKPLFTAYAVARMIAPAIQTVKYPVAKLCINTPAGMELSPEKVRARTRNVARTIRKSVGYATFKSAFRVVSARCKTLAGDLLISGKDYILKLLHHKLRCIFGFWGTLEQLKVALAGGWDTRSEPYLARRVRALIAP